MRPFPAHSNKARRDPPLRSRRSPMHSPAHAHFESLPVPVTLALVLAALVYARGWFRLRKAFPNTISLWSLGAFMSGLFSLWIPVGTRVAALDHVLLTAHMLQHLLLMAV